MTTPIALDTLPVELLYEIQQHALSPSLPLVSQHLRQVFLSAPLSVRAHYLLHAACRAPPNVAALWTKALRFPLCTKDVLAALLRSPACPTPLRSPAYLTPPPGHPELPRRLFRTLAPRTALGWSTHDAPLPFLRYLYAHERIPPPDPNAHDGYALTRAVHAGFMPLIAFLLDHGADPACKGGLAVKVAISKKDIGLVKLLVERTAPPPDTSTRHGTKRKAVDEPMALPKGKRRRMEDRVRCDAEMLRVAIKAGAMDIVHYLRDEKGCVPDLKTLQMIGA